MNLQSRYLVAVCAGGILGGTLFFFLIGKRVQTNGYAQPPEDIEIKITTDRTAYFRLEPIPLKVSYRNYGSSEVDFNVWEQGDYPVRFHARDEFNREIPLTDAGRQYIDKAEHSSRTWGTAWPLGTMLKSGQVSHETFFLTEYLDLTKVESKMGGKAEIEVVFERFGRDSNPVKITLMPWYFDLKDRLVQEVLRTGKMQSDSLTRPADE